MELEEIKQKKAVLEKSIAQSVSEFEKATSTTIDAIEITKGETLIESNWSKRIKVKINFE